MKITNAFDGTKSKKGDRVYSLRYGWGTVSYNYPSNVYPIGVIFDEHAEITPNFTNEGKYSINDNFIDLYYGPPEIIGPPKLKRRVQKTVKRWANVYPLERYSGLYPTKEYADFNVYPGRIACVELVGVYEVEED